MLLAEAERAAAGARAKAREIGVAMAIAFLASLENTLMAKADELRERLEIAEESHG